MAAAMGLGVVIPAVPVIAAPATSGWVNTAAGWTYYKSGVKATGWVLDGGKWYLLDSNGVMKTGWAKDAGTWYFLNANGAMATNWVKDTDGKWYFLNTSGAMVANTWVGNYYLGATGAMATSQLVNGWYVDANGAWDGKAQYDLAAVEAAVAKAEASKAHGDIDAAKALVNALPAVAEKTAFTTRLAAIVVNLEVSGVSAVNATTLTVAGYGLNQLAATDITIAGNTVVSVSPDATGTSAKVVLANKVLPNTENTVTIKGTDYKFTFGLVVNTVAVNSVTVDDNKAGQALTLKINGVDMDVDTLNAADYVVDFVALDKDNNDATAALFDNTNTGDLNATLPTGDYKVYATVHKDNTVVNSDAATVKVRNLDQTATTINKYELTNITNGVVQNSTTLVVGDTADFTNLNVTANGDTFDTSAVAGYTHEANVKSSAPGVISVNADGTLTANAPGTATITVAYGDITKAITFTVTNTARELTKASVSSSSFSLIYDKTTAPHTKSVDVNTYDQYGDPIEADAYLMSSALIGVVTADDGAPITIDGKIHALKTSVYSAADKAAYDTVTFTSAAKGSGQMYVCDGSGKVLTSIAINVTDVNNVGSTRLELVKDTTDDTRSTDNSLNLFADKNVVYNLNNYTTENVFNGTVDLTGYTIQYNPNVVNVTATAAPTVINNGLVKVALDANTTDIAITAVGTGSTDVVLYDSTGAPVTGGKVTLTVTNSAPTISGVTFKSNPTIDYSGKTIKASTVLSLTSSPDDDIVSGITLTTASGHATRVVDDVLDANVGLIYIDKNDNGTYDATDYKLGFVQEKVVSGATGLATPITNAFTGITTASGDNGTVLFTIENLAGTKVYTSTTVTVDVK